MVLYLTNTIFTPFCNKICLVLEIGSVLLSHLSFLHLPVFFLERLGKQIAIKQRKLQQTTTEAIIVVFFLNQRRLKGSVALPLGLGLKLRIGGRRDKRLSRGLQWQPVTSLEPCPGCTAPLSLRLNSQQFSLQSRRAAGLAVPQQLALVRICISLCL